MIYIAFTLGLFGSLHCIGMCGPLAFALMPGVSNRSRESFFMALKYNLGRITSYVILGLVMGVFSEFINLAGFQKPITIAMGIMFILLFLASMDLEKLFFKSEKITALISRYRSYLGKKLSAAASKNTYFTGILNGLVPCGLLYLALAGAVTTDGLIDAGIFMLFFGLGTFPAMFLLLISASIFDFRKRIKLSSVFSVLQLFVGIFLIYRALYIDLPANLELMWGMGKIMCH